MVKRLGMASIVAIALALVLMPAYAGGGRAGRRGGGGGGDAGGGEQGAPRTVFFVQVIEKGVKTGMTDALVFRGDTFDSLGCHQFGFGPGEIKRTKAGQEVTFTAMTKSATQGTMAWSGTQKGKAISGTMKWTPAKGKAKEYTFSGTMHEPSGMLDGTKWKAELTAAGEKPMADTLVFTEGRFDSEGCHQYGFRRGPYTAMKKEGGTKFTAFTTSREQGTMQWDGIVKGDSISGTMMWYPKTGAAKKYTVSGKKQ